MGTLLDEIKKLNATMQRLADRLAPEADFGVLDNYKAFRVRSHGGSPLLTGIKCPDPVTFKELRGIAEIVSRLKANTEQFIAGLPCNNVLLYGPRGTGKSSVVKALLNHYAAKGLCIIEIPKDALVHIFEIQEMIRPRRERYILFCDDLSFSEDDDSYVPVKTVLEGGLETRPDNALIYATSNRRHLMPEKAVDNMPVLSAGELQPAETLEEKMSLSDRFGLRLGFEHYTADTYLEIVSNYAKLRGILLNPEELRSRALTWTLSQGGFSGRAARQFIDDLDGSIKNKPRRSGGPSTGSG
ncbi:MAG: hypothetical protein C0402_15765 [Thermodesulfovibrio sp.]|nr:hypothetical protein [Thermodesulfovibrio sp.]